MTKKHFWGLEASDPPSYSGKSPLRNRVFSPLSSSILWSFGLKDAKLSGWLARQIILERLTSLSAPVRLDWKLGSVLSIHPPLFLSCLSMPLAYETFALHVDRVVLALDNDWLFLESWNTNRRRHLVSMGRVYYQTSLQTRRWGQSI